jgi:drug/metabolite transporter (DMT)-like permease
MSPSVAAALAAALLFGASTPFAKVLVGDVAPVLLAGLLYLGSGVGLWIVRVVRDRGFKSAGLSAAEWPWLASAIIAGGILGPILLMYGLARIAAADASLLLNLEAVLTALLAWLVFRENADRRIVLAMALIVAGGVALAWPTSRSGHSSLAGALAVAGACMCWAVDNNLTRKVSASDSVFIAGTKGWVAGLTTSALALTFGAKLPTVELIAAAMAVGFAGYGLSLVLFVLALRGLGSARTSAYFSIAPFVGAAIAIVAFHEPVSWPLWLAATMMAAGVWLHLTEAHAHEHTHELLTHTHAHRHDAHHQHQHAFAWDGHEPHTHQHSHEPLTHTHRHYPDVHHRHEH